MIAIGCDSAGYELKRHVMAYLDGEGVEYKDFGSNEGETVDYPLYARAVAGAILRGECDKGILICGTGIGISIAANRHKGIRAALCHDVFSAKATRQHNDANILAMGGRVIGPGPAIEILKAFLETVFDGSEAQARHVSRIKMLDE